MTLNQDETLELLKNRGARIEPIKKHCVFQKMFDINVFKYCRQTGNPDYAWNLGSAGGPVISCEGAPQPSAISLPSGIIGGPELPAFNYAPVPPPCPHYIEKGEVIGWKILLPKTKY